MEKVSVFFLITMIIFELDNPNRLLNCDCFSVFYIIANYENNYMFDSVVLVVFCMQYLIKRTRKLILSLLKKKWMTPKTSSVRKSMQRGVIKPLLFISLYNYHYFLNVSEIVKHHIIKVHCWDAVIDFTFPLAQRAFCNFVIYIYVCATSEFVSSIFYSILLH